MIRRLSPSQAISRSRQGVLVTFLAYPPSVESTKISPLMTTAIFFPSGETRNSDIDSPVSVTVRFSFGSFGEVIGTAADRPLSRSVTQIPKSRS
jgi:hypothetical protein